MIWFFERDNAVTRLQTAFDNDTQEYILVIEAPATDVRTERFSTQQAFGARLADLEQQFKAQNWVQRDNVEIIDDGWKGPTTNHH